MKCDFCGKPHHRKRFCSDKCKDRWHNKHNPRGIALSKNHFSKDLENQRIHECGLDSVESGWDGHKNIF
jgi:ribosomal protein L24E